MHPLAEHGTGSDPELDASSGLPDTITTGSSGLTTLSLIKTMVDSRLLQLDSGRGKLNMDHGFGCERVLNRMSCSYEHPFFDGTRNAYNVHLRRIQLGNIGESAMLWRPTYHGVAQLAINIRFISALCDGTWTQTRFVLFWYRVVFGIRLIGDLDDDQFHG